MSNEIAKPESGLWIWFDPFIFLEVPSSGDEMKESIMPTIVKVVVGLGCVTGLLFGAKLYYEGRIFHPDVDECRSEIMAQIATPSTFKEYRITRSVGTVFTDIYIEYDSENIYGASIRNIHGCKFRNDQTSLERAELRLKESEAALVEARAELKAAAE